MTRSAISSFSRKTPLWARKASTRVDFPASTWAITAIFIIFFLLLMLIKMFSASPFYLCANWNSKSTRVKKSPSKRARHYNTPKRPVGGALYRRDGGSLQAFLSYEGIKGCFFAFFAVSDSADGLQVNGEFVVAVDFEDLVTVALCEGAYSAGSQF